MGILCTIGNAFIALYTRQSIPSPPHNLTIETFKLFFIFLDPNMQKIGSNGLLLVDVDAKNVDVEG